MAQDEAKMAEMRAKNAWMRPKIAEKHIKKHIKQHIHVCICVYIYITVDKYAYIYK